MYNVNGQFGLTVRELSMALMAMVGASAMALLIYYSFNPTKKLIQNSDVNDDVYATDGLGNKFKDTLNDYDY